MNDAKFDRLLLSQEAQDILAQGRRDDKTSGHAGQVFASNFIQFPIEGVAWLAGAAEDILQGSADSLEILVTQGDFYNPFSRLVDAKDMQHSAHWERSAQDHIAKPLKNFLGLGEVNVTTFESLNDEQKEVYAKEHGDQEGGYLSGVYTVDGENYYPVDEAVGAAIVSSYVADPTMLMAGVGVFSKLKMAGDFARKMDKFAMPALGLTVGHMGLDAVSDMKMEPADIKNFLERFTDDGWYASLDKDRGIRYMKDDLNELYEEAINIGFDSRSETAMKTLYRSSSELDYETSRRMGAAVLKAYDYRAGKKTLNTTLDAQVYKSVLNLEQRFYDLAEEYVRSPETFDPSRSELLTMQAVLVGNSKMYSFGEEHKADTFDALRDHLGIKADTDLSVAFQKAQDFITTEKAALGVEFDNTEDRMKALRVQEINESLKGMSF